MTQSNGDNKSDSKAEAYSVTKYGSYRDEIINAYAAGCEAAQSELSEEIEKHKVDFAKIQTLITEQEEAGSKHDVCRARVNLCKAKNESLEAALAVEKGKVEELTEAVVEAKNFISNFPYPMQTKDQIEKREQGLKVYCLLVKALNLTAPNGDLKESVK